MTCGTLPGLALRSARSPDGAQRNPGSRIADSAPDFASLHPGYDSEQASSPRGLVGARARRSLSRAFPSNRHTKSFPQTPVGARGTQALWLPAASVRLKTSDTPKTNRTGAQSSSRLRSARGGSDRLAACPRRRRLRRRLSRSCELSPGHALGPPARLSRRLYPSPPTGTLKIPTAETGPASLRPPPPVPRNDRRLETRPSPDRVVRIIFLKKRKSTTFLV